MSNLEKIYIPKKAALLWMSLMRSKQKSQKLQVRWQLWHWNGFLQIFVQAGGVARMADPRIVEEVMNAVSIPVMAKVRIGHIVEARILESMGVD